MLVAVVCNFCEHCSNNEQSMYIIKTMPPDNRDSITDFVNVQAAIALWGELSRGECPIQYRRGKGPRGSSPAGELSRGKLSRGKCPTPFYTFTDEASTSS